MRLLPHLRRSSRTVARRGSQLVVAIAAAITMGAGLLAMTPSTATAAPVSNRWYGSAPYLQVQSEHVPDPVQVMNNTGQKAFQLAFILAPSGGGCTPMWDGTLPLSSDGAISDMVGRIRSNGGDVSVSFGGAGGRKLGEVCGTPEATARAYQQVINRYQLRAIDIDIETTEFENDNRTGAKNEFGAAKILQRDNPGLFVSITLPGYKELGLGYWGNLLLDEAESIGFVPDNYSLMTFDGHFNGAADQITTLTALKNILKSRYGWSDATAYAHVGFSGMNGRTDQLPDGSVEYFRQADFQQVLDFALANGMGRYTFWSVNRDRQCDPVDNGQTSSTCSSIAQNAFDFTKFTARFGNAGTASSGFDPYGTTYATGYSSQYGTQLQASGEGGQCVGWINRGNWLKYEDARFGSTGAVELWVRYASQATRGGWIELRLDSVHNAPVGRFWADGTGGWRTWASKKMTFPEITGTHDVFLYFNTDHRDDFVNVHRFMFDRS